MGLKQVLQKWLLPAGWQQFNVKQYRGHAPTEEDSLKGYAHISEATDLASSRMDDIQSGVLQPILNTGWPSLSGRNLMQDSSLHVVHGMSGSAKTQFALQVLLGTAIELYINDTPGIVLMNSLEMTDWRLANRLASALADVNYQPIERKDGNQQENVNLMKYYNSFIGSLPIWLDDSAAISTKEMSQNIEQIYENKGKIHLLVTDYGELFTDKDSSREREMDTIFRSQRIIAHNYKTSVLAISQSTYSIEDSISKYKIAGPNGMRYSRAIRAASDVIIEVWNPIAMRSAGVDFAIRNDLDGEHFWLLVEKFRNGSPAVDFALDWKPTSTRLSDPTLQTGNFNVKPELYQNLNIALDKFSSEQGVF